MTKELDKDKLSTLYFEEHVLQGQRYVVKAAYFGHRQWHAEIWYQGHRYYECGDFVEAKEAFFCAKAALAFFLIFGDFDYMGAHDERED